MPNINRMGTVYVPTGNPDTVDVVSLYAEGELGVAYDWVDRAYQIVKFDSGANTILASAANQLLYWKDRARYIVTTDSAQAQGGVGGTNQFRNEVAGILRCAAHSGYYIHMLIRGRNIPVLSSGGAFVVGDWVVPHTTAAQVVAVTAGTAPGIIAVGTAHTATAASPVYTDVDLTNIP